MSGDLRPLYISDLAEPVGLMRSFCKEGEVQGGGGSREEREKEGEWYKGLPDEARDGLHVALNYQVTR